MQPLKAALGDQGNAVIHVRATLRKWDDPALDPALDPPTSVEQFWVNAKGEPVTDPAKIAELDAQVAAAKQESEE